MSRLHWIHLGHIVNPDPRSLCHHISEADPVSILPPYARAAHFLKVVGYEELWESRHSIWFLNDD